MNIDRTNQVWASDITYIPMETGFIYLTLIMDWYSRKVLSWRLSNSLDSSFCVDALEEAIHRYGKPAIFNSDQGSQFTSTSFTETLLDQDIRISMDGKGAWRDNVFVERLWRSVKYEEVYLKAYESMANAKQSSPFIVPELSRRFYPNYEYYTLEFSGVILRQSPEIYLLVNKRSSFSSRFQVLPH